MAKQSGLGMQFYLSGYDLSNDVGSLSKIGGGPALLDVTPISASAFERLGGLRTGDVEFTTFHDTATGKEHAALSTLPRGDVHSMTTIGTTIGNSAACMVSKQLDYDPTRAANGMLTFKVATQSNGYGLEWGNLLTAGLRTDTAATNGTSLDGAPGFTAPSVPASGTPVTNTYALPATVVITGGTMTAVVINGVTVGTGAGTYTLPAGQSITLTYTVAPTWTWTAQSAYGAQAYLQVTAFTGTDVTVKIQDSADNSSFTDVTGLTFAQTTAAHTAQRIATANTATIRRYLRAVTVTSAGFTSATFAVTVVRNQIAGQVF